MSANPAPYVPKEYWEKRYSQLDIQRSGHMDLPEAFNRWLYHRKRGCLKRGLVSLGFTTNSAHILELGAGTGVYVEKWVQEGAQVTGVDLSHAAMQALQSRFPKHRFFSGDITDSGFSAQFGGGYDLVTAMDILYHITEDPAWERGLAMVHEQLKPGGLFVFTDQFRHGTSLERGYIKWRTLKEYELALQRHGFLIESRMPIFFTMIQVGDTFPARLCQLLDVLWDYTYPRIQRFPAVMGPITYCTDTLLSFLVCEGPSMELMVCRKKG